MRCILGRILRGAYSRCSHQRSLFASAFGYLQVFFISVYYLFSPFPYPPSFHQSGALSPNTSSSESSLTRFSVGEVVVSSPVDSSGDVQLRFDTICRPLRAVSDLCWPSTSEISLFIFAQSHALTFIGLEGLWGTVV